jgi:isopropylmalate/homocitrate/citramalate synthase
MKRRVSPYNVAPQIAHPPIICDVTLREGEQTAGVSFSQEEREHFIELLEAAHLPQVQLYNTWHGEQVDERAMQINSDLCAIPRKYLKTEVLNFNTSDMKKLKQMIDLQAETKPDIIHASFSLNAATEEALVDEEHRIQETAEYIASKGLECNISLINATRSDARILARMVKAAAKSGASRVRLADTVGVADPSGIENMCRIALSALEGTSTILGIHTHNDFGLGLADALAAIRAGASLVDGSVNGLGERCGNASLVEIIMALEGMYGIKTGIDCTLLLKIAQYVSQISGIPIPTNMPFVGKYAFSDSLAAHILMSVKDPLAVQGILPEEFGSKRLAFLSKNITEEALWVLVQRQGLSLKKDDMKELYNLICREIDVQKGKVLTEEDLPRLAKEL